MGLEENRETIPVPRQSYESVNGQYYYILSYKPNSYTYKTSVYKCDEDGSIIEHMPIWSIASTDLDTLNNNHEMVVEKLAEIIRGAE